jgi:hypothetical protein
MSIGSPNKLALALVSGVFIAFASGQAFAQQATGTQQQQPAAGLSAEQVQAYTADPSKLIADFASNPDGLASAITQIATSGTAGANAATVALQLAVSTGNKELAQAVSKGLGVAVARLTQSGNIALASSIQASVAAISANAPSEIADAMNSSFSTGQNAVATAAVGAGGSDAGTGSAGTGAGGNGSNGGTTGAANSFASSGGGGGSSESTTSNSTSGSTFSGTGSSTASASPT